MIKSSLMKYRVLKFIEEDILTNYPIHGTIYFNPVNQNMQLMKTKYMYTFYNLDTRGVNWIRKNLKDRGIIKCSTSKGCRIINQNFKQTKIDIDFIIENESYKK